MRYERTAEWFMAAILAALSWTSAVSAESMESAGNAVAAKPPAAQNAGTGTNAAGTAMDEAAWEAALAAGAAVSAVHGTVPQETTAAPQEEASTAVSSESGAAAAAPQPDAAAAAAPSQPMQEMQPTQEIQPAQELKAAQEVHTVQEAQSKQAETQAENAALMPNAASRIKELMQKFRLSGDPKSGAYSWIYTSPTWTAEAVSRPAAGSSYFLLAGAESLRFQSLDCDEVWYFHEGCGMKMTILLADGTVRTFELGVQGQAMPMILLPKGQIFAAENIVPTGYSFISCMTVPALATTGIRVWQREELLLRYPQAKDLIERYTDAPLVQGTVSNGASDAGMAANGTQSYPPDEAAAKTLPQINAAAQTGGEVHGRNGAYKDFGEDS